jgi:hypothetical protein
MPSTELDRAFFAGANDPDRSRWPARLDRLAVFTIVAICGLVFSEVVSTVASSGIGSISDTTIWSSSWGFAFVLAIWALALGFVLVLWLTHRQDEVVEVSRESRTNVQPPITSELGDDDDGEESTRPGMPGRWLIH